jgi:hypothetical protein
MTYEKTVMRQGRDRVGLAYQRAPAAAPVELARQLRTRARRRGGRGGVAVERLAVDVAERARRAIEVLLRAGRHVLDHEPRGGFGLLRFA